MKIQKSSISKFIKEYGDKKDFNKKNIKFCSWIKRLYYKDASSPSIDYRYSANKNLACVETDKLNLKFMEIQEINTHLKNKVRGLACLNIKIYYRATVDEILCDFLFVIGRTCMPWGS